MPRLGQRDEVRRLGRARPLCQLSEREAVAAVQRTHGGADQRRRQVGRERVRRVGAALHVSWVVGWLGGWVVGRVDGWCWAGGWGTEASAYAELGKAMRARESEGLGDGGEVA